MATPEQLLDSAKQATERAIEYDKKGQQESAAAYFYRSAADLLDQAIRIVADETRKELWNTRAQEYRSRAAKLEAIYDNRQLENSKEKQTTPENKQVSQCYFLFSQGLRADENGEQEKAIEFYTDAVEAGIEFKSTNEELVKKIKAIAFQALERAEQLKGITNAPKKVTTPSVSSQSTVQSVNDSTLSVSGGAKGYTEQEKRVLMLTSEINNIKYVPFMAMDLNEQFRYAVPFSDKDGKLKLAPKQLKAFADWVRPDDICSDPKLIASPGIPDCFSIKQTVISDCSFVASLAVSALYEKRFKRPLVTKIIYPRDSKNQPIYNPFGKYMIKLYINGVRRKILIDDYLPVGRHNQLLCSYSNKPNEFWISLLEKAYMKVMGGYDFPGSNSNIDLHALTGWIPERVSVTRDDRTSAKTISLVENLMTRLANGQVLMTVATGNIPESEAERSGLVPSHAYAVFDIREVNGVKLFLLKNPWSHVRWKGNYSELDVVHWNDELRSQLPYDPYSTSEFDNGVFWIDYESICSFFDVFYLSWNPELFQYTYCIHEQWSAGSGPIRDSYNIGENPQFSLEVEKSSGAVWILLTRHITQIDDFRENREYITILVYKNNGKRVYYPYDPEPYIDGVRINSPHYLCKLKYDADSPKKYTLVVSEYEKMNTIYYTLRAYSTCPFTLKEIFDPFVKKEVISSEWDAKTAGGCPNYPTFNINPKYRLTIDSNSDNNQIYIDLKGPREYEIGFEVQISKVNDETITAPFNTKSSGPFRTGYVYIALDNIPSGCLDIVPSTFVPGCIGPFILTIKASTKLIQIQRIR